jgi:hypothetical protein
MVLADGVLEIQQQKFPEMRPLDSSCIVRPSVRNNMSSAELISVKFDSLRCVPKLLTVELQQGAGVAQSV